MIDKLLILAGYAVAGYALYRGYYATALGGVVLITASVVIGNAIRKWRMGR